MTHPMTRAAVSAFANLTGRRKAKAKESKAAEDEEVMEDEEGTEAEDKTAEEESEANDDTEAMDDEKESKAEDGEEEDDMEADKAAKSAEYKRGMADQKARISAIFNSEEANGKGESAMHLALNTDLCVTDAKAVLAGISKGASKSKLDQAMESGGHYSAGVDAGRGNPAAGNHGWDKTAATINAQFGRKK